MPNFLQNHCTSIDALVSDIMHIKFDQVGNRLVAWFGNSAYSYSKHCHKSNVKCPSSITSLFVTLNNICKSDFNSVLINVYKNGDSSIGWHSDDEPELDQNHPIASVSIGETRLFEVKHKHRAYQYTQPMLHGLLMIMHGSFQAEFQHRVPMDTTCNSYRINLTFRRCLPA